MVAYETFTESGIFKFLLMVLKITVGDSFTLIHKTFPEKTIQNIQSPPRRARQCRRNNVNACPSEVNFSERQSALKQKAKTTDKILLFVTTYTPAVSILQAINWRTTRVLLRTKNNAGEKFQETSLRIIQEG